MFDLRVGQYKLIRRLIFGARIEMLFMSILCISETKSFGESVGSVSHHGEWNYRIVPDRESFLLKVLISI